jgi:uncharacterized membrane protein
MASLNTKQIAAIGVMGALAAVGTMIFAFPIPATSGYFNFGDVFVQISALVFGPVVGAIAGGLGSGLADLLGGWYTYVIPTAIIKGTEGYITGKLAGEKEGRTLKKTLIAWAAGAAMIPLGYFIFQSFLYGIPAAAVEIPFNVFQGVVAGAIGIPISIALKDRLDI